MERINKDIGMIIREGFGYLLPELAIIFLLLSIVLIGLIFRSRKSWLLVWVLFAGLVIIAGILIRFTLVSGLQEGRELFSGFILTDGLGIFYRMLFVLAGLLFLVLSSMRNLAWKKKSDLEYQVIFLGILLGSMFLVMTTHLLMIYLSIEIISLSSYLLTMFGFNRKSYESGLKYVLYGAVSSAIMLMGISLLYGFTGTLNITSVEFMEGLSQIPSFPAFFAVFLSLAGFLFKMSVVPFHFWTPDVYEGAPVPLIAFFSVVPKLAGMVALMRFYLLVNNSYSSLDWNTLLGMAAILTMLAGNLSALWQKEAKRMMAYSSIAHSGYIMVGVLVAGITGLEPVIFYSVAYLLMNFLVFALIEILAKKTDNCLMEDYSGQFRVNPSLAVFFTVGFIGLIGIPPTIGFTSKFILFSSAWQTYGVTGQPIFVWLVVLGLLNTLVSVFYYIRIPYFMAFREPEKSPVNKIEISKIYWVFCLFLAFLIVLLFLRPDGLNAILENYNFVIKGLK